MEIHKRLKKIRLTVGLTQSDMADRIGTKKSAYSHYETGIRPLPESVAATICRIFYINEEWLLEGKGEMINSEAESVGADILLKRIYSLAQDLSKYPKSLPSVIHHMEFLKFIVETKGSI
ncbi:MAG: helix-turn-helix domain-containing protein [Clostridiales bacterium]|jgi:transcriptional regulator with XRE-family HTH domain|nr:helix-turn-helix domain-containing protein [Clostridiales bacterium]MDR2750144.1 helix-turn-helix domain-containing protein [Clostridiales bacterium]